MGSGFKKRLIDHDLSFISVTKGASKEALTDEGQSQGGEPMPYTKDTAPDAINKMPDGAQAIWISAHNAAFEEYKGDEGKSAGTAYAAVKNKYEQDKDGNWVEKQAATESLRSLQNEIIQEVGKRNAAADSARVRKIMEICQELLSSEAPAEDQITGAVAEAKSTLDWLKEQAVTKSEDGEDFPAGAYAYVPDDQKPSTWKLRLWEDLTKKVTRKQVGAAAAAFSPGGFRGQKVQIPADDVSAVKAKVRAVYHSLDVPDEEIPKWVKEANEMRDYCKESLEIPISEITADGMAKGILPVRIIQPGFNASKARFYEGTAVKDTPQLFEGVKMYANHATKTEEKERPERDIRDWTATLRNIKVSEKGSAVGEAHIHAGWFKEMVQGLYEAGSLDKLGTSINTLGKGARQKRDGVDTFVVEHLIDHPFKSVDFVTEAGAGGQAGVRESIDATPAVDLYLADLSTLKEVRPDLVKQIQAEVNTKSLTEVKKKMDEDTKELQELREARALAERERDEYKLKAAELEAKQRKADAQAIIHEAVAKADLPDPSKERILEALKDADSAVGVATAIKDEQDYIARLSESGRVKNLGKTEAPKVDPKELRESAKRLLGAGATEAQIDAFVRGR